VSEGIRKRADRPKPYEAWVFDKRTGKKLRQSFRLEREARQWRQDTIRELQLGLIRGVASSTLSNAAAEYVAGMKDGSILALGGRPYRARVAREYEATLRRSVLPTLGEYRLDEIRRRDLVDLADRMRADGYAPSTIRHAIDTVRVVLRRAVEREELAVNPSIGLRIGGGDQTPRDRVASPLETAALVAALPRVMDRALWSVALYAGLRAGEIRALEWQHVRLGAGVIVVDQAMDNRGVVTPPKSRAGSRRVMMMQPLRDALEAWRDAAPDTTSTGRVFGSRAQPLAFTPLYRRAGKAWAAAGLDPIALHEARHSAVSTWLMAGVNLKTASAMAGHASIAITTDRYGHLLPGAEDEALALITAYTERSER
jgi:integrase